MSRSVFAALIDQRASRGRNRGSIELKSRPLEVGSADLLGKMPAGIQETPGIARSFLGQQLGHAGFKGISFVTFERDDGGRGGERIPQRRSRKRSQDREGNQSNVDSAGLQGIRRSKCFAGKRTAGHQIDRVSSAPDNDRILQIKRGRLAVRAVLTRDPKINRALYSA